MNITKSHSVLLLLLLFCQLPLAAQWNKTESVLKDHAWYKIGVVEDGIYALDRTALLSYGIDPQTINPANIRLYGNVPGMLPEANGADRFDDLNEIAIQVTGAQDGSFDEDDKILFYGQGPVNLTWNSLGYFNYERNSYTDTIYYFLCVDSDQPGLRITEKESSLVPEGSVSITRFPYCFYHESEEISPYASGRRWYGDLITPQEGSKTFSFEVPDLVGSEVLRIKSRVLGRCSSRFTYNMKVNDNIVVNQFGLDAYVNLKFGTESEVDRMCFVDSDHIEVSYSLNPVSATPLFYIDFFSATCWRELKYHGNELAFQLVRSQMTTPMAEVRLSGVGPSDCCWDVTDPLQPAIQLMSNQGGFSVFGIESAAFKRYHLFEPSALKAVASCYPIHNQNLHAINSAEMLIITPRLFWEQAETLAAFHREEDDMNCVVVDINEIYNEFGTGTTDPTAMRDFIRMVYLRGHNSLKYVLLMGKGTHDYRDIKGFANNYVPTYENTDRPWYELASVCTDDYFGIMGSAEGENCSGRVDLGVGRFPITTPEQGDDVIAKIKHYHDLSESHGAWKNTHLFVADNDSKTYMSYCQDLDFILDTMDYALTSKKIYAESYPLVSTPSGKRIPEGHDALVKALDDGVLVMSYTGHGGVKGLMDELIITTSDILAMDNYDRLPFVHTATCEFSKFDNPNLVSAGEQMFTNPHGGAIAMLTTVRPTIAQNNQMLSRSFHLHVYEREDGQPLRFGDIFRIVKSDSKYYSQMNLGYYLFGDPALQLALPKKVVNIAKINGQNPNAQQTIAAASEMTIEGMISQTGSKIDTLFNGVVDVCLFDKATKFTTLGLHFDPINYTFYNDVLFKGKATVEKGKFTIKMILPANVNYFDGEARLSFYAYDSIRKIDASGIYDKLDVVGVTPSTVLDTQGPDINLYWNTPDFESGDVVSRNGTLCADLFDEQGIYHYNVSIGRDILLNSTISQYDDLVLNEYYEPALDDYRRGSIKLRMNDLSNGTHEFKLKAWDTQNNATEVEIFIIVEDGIMLAQVRNAPNPFTDETWFSFIHGDKTEEVSVRVEVFDMLGRRVAEINEHTSATAGVVPAIRWNGRSNNGQRLKAGVYVYRLSVTDAQGKTRTVSNRLVIG